MEIRLLNLHGIIRIITFLADSDRRVRTNSSSRASNKPRLS